MVKVDFRYQENLQPVIARLEEKKKQLDAARPLPDAALRNIREAMSIEWTYNSNAIEGNSLTLRETQMVLEEGVTISGKSLREHFEAKNHETALKHLTALAQDAEAALRASEILTLHSYVLRSIEDDYAGRLRTGAVRIVGANFIPPNAQKVPDLLDALVDYVNANPDALSAIELATVFHHQFVHIHPFFDGNGRTVRLVMNLLLMRSGFPPAIILKTDRKKYYEALNQANTGKYEKLMLLMCQALERSLNIYLSAIPGADAYLPISNLVEEEAMPYGQEYLSLLARRGKIDAHKEGRVWYTSKEAVARYMNSKGKA
ncbi:MAG: Fic family protein [Schleiferiaceae bacterium]|nr:Fic family protein [Schleiferiaceae bacterium]